MRDFPTLARVMLLASSLLGLGLGAQAWACPFCTSVSQTFSEEMNTMQVVVFATMEKAPDVPASELNDPDAELPKAQFRISQVLKGAEWAAEGQVIEVLFFGEAVKDRTYLVMGTDAPKVMWSTPLGLSARAHAYVQQLLALPEGPERLEFFQDYLEDEDEMLARDAYDEFAKTPYSGVQTLEGKMHHDRLIEFVKDPEVPASRRRLYFVMLGICGKAEDAPLLRTMMTSSDRSQKAGLDALLACYLILTKEAGLAEVEKLFLANTDAEYADTYAAIMAIRFHGNETNVLDKQRLIESLRHLLDRPELADLVIPDLARWKDWDVMPRMVELFKNADEKSSWVRVPVINYLRSCPLPAAKAYIDELAKIDPEAVKRAQTFFPFDSTDKAGTDTKSTDGSQAPPSTDEKSSSVQPQPPRQVSTTVLTASPLAAQPEATQPDDKVEASRDETPSDAPATSEPTDAEDLPADQPAAEPAATVAPNTTDTSKDEPESDESAPASGEARTPRRPTASLPVWQPNQVTLWTVPIVTGVALMYLLRLVLGVPLTRFEG